MAITRRKPDPDGVTTARLAGASGRHTNRKQIDVDAAIAELQEIANGRGDLLAERAGVTLGFYARENTQTSGSEGRLKPRCASLLAPT
jgi:hypothetical protein